MGNAPRRKEHGANDDSEETVPKYHDAGRKQKALYGNGEHWREAFADGGHRLEEGGDGRDFKGEGSIPIVVLFVQRIRARDSR